jgi:hypothetical protein
VSNLLPVGKQRNTPNPIGFEALELNDWAKTYRAIVTVQ